MKRRVLDASTRNDERLVPILLFLSFLTPNLYVSRGSTPPYASNTSGSLTSESGTASASGTTARFTLNLVDPPPGRPPYHEYVSGVTPTGDVVLPGGPMRLWFEIGVEGWDADQDGSPLLGEWHLELDPSPVTFQTGSAGLAVEPCVSDAECEDALGPGARCADPPGNPQFCTPAFLDLNRCDWPFDTTGVAPVGPPYSTFTGSTVSAGPVADDGSSRYGGTVVIDVSSDARGSAFDFLFNANSGWMADGNGSSIPVELPIGLRLGVPFGRCCYGFGTPASGCAGDTTYFECDTYAAPRKFDSPPGSLCSESCSNCAFNSNCGDNNACTTDICNVFGECVRTLNYNPSTECCRWINGNVSPLGDGNDCTFDECDFITGQATHTPIPAGGSCDDNDPCTVNTTCNASGQCRGQQDTGPGCPMNRYLVFTVSDVSFSACNEQHAVRVTLVDVDGFPAANGEVRWIGAPDDFPLGLGPAPTYMAAPLSCDPYFTDWTSLGDVHVFGNAVLPGSSYLIEVVEQNCLDLDDASCYFGTLMVQTSARGDVAAPFGAANFADIAALVSAFKGEAYAPVKPRAHLAANVPDPGAAITFMDISACVSAFRGLPSTYTGPSACP